jgi:hypothetical protein
MAYEQKEGDIIIFKNKNKEGNQPDYRGNGLDLNGQKIDISLWIKEGANGKFMAGRIQPEYVKDSQPDPETEENDDLPF